MPMNVDIVSFIRRLRQATLLLDVRVSRLSILPLSVIKYVYEDSFINHFTGQYIFIYFFNTPCWALIAPIIGVFNLYGLIFAMARMDWRLSWIPMMHPLKQILFSLSSLCLTSMVILLALFTIIQERRQDFSPWL